MQYVRNSWHRRPSATVAAAKPLASELVWEVEGIAAELGLPRARCVPSFANRRASRSKNRRQMVLVRGRRCADTSRRPWRGGVRNGRSQSEEARG